MALNIFNFTDVTNITNMHLNHDVLQKCLHRQENLTRTGEKWSTIKTNERKISYIAHFRLQKEKTQRQGKLKTLTL